MVVEDLPIVVAVVDIEVVIVVEEETTIVAQDLHIMQPLAMILVLDQMLQSHRLQLERPQKRNLVCLVRKKTKQN